MNYTLLRFGPSYTNPLIYLKEKGNLLVYGLHYHQNKCTTVGFSQFINIITNIGYCHTPNKLVIEQGLYNGRR